MSVPQIVVVVTRTKASSGPTSGTGFSSRTMRPGSTKTAAFIFIFGISSAFDCQMTSEDHRRRGRINGPAPILGWRAD